MQRTDRRGGGRQGGKVGELGKWVRFCLKCDTFRSELALCGDATHRYWGELEHFHNFDRRGLSELLKSEGLTPVHYTVSRSACRALCVLSSLGARCRLGQRQLGTIPSALIAHSECGVDGCG